MRDIDSLREQSDSRHINGTAYHYDTDDYGIDNDDGGIYFPTPDEWAAYLKSWGMTPEEYDRSIDELHESRRQSEEAERYYRETGMIYWPL